ncbi:MAG: orotate phosphoribosyltransferase-like protein [Methanomicrobiales archaeon]
MTSLEDLIARAKQLQGDGHSTGQIADELSLSAETVTWLLTQKEGEEAPKDVHIDWTAVSCNAELLAEIALMLRLHHERAVEESRREASGPPEVVVGIALSGVPLATIIAVEEGLKLGVYHPAKHSPGTQVGSLSGNFAQLGGKRCIIVDDVITSGRTMKETIDYLRRHHAIPLSIWTIFDKRGLREVDGIPVETLFGVSRIG